MSYNIKDMKVEKAWFEKALAPLGYTVGQDYGSAVGFFDGHDTDFWLSSDGNGEGGHIAFAAKSQEEVQGFYEAALAAGGKDNGKPGYRSYWEGYYAAFVYDPEGNNVEAVFYDYDYNAAHS
jgi:catechol 2,3-dioxygenase-like lactoylglutathione lyase family enzyme